MNNCNKKYEFIAICYYYKKNYSEAIKYYLKMNNCNRKFKYIGYCYYYDNAYN